MNPRPTVSTVPSCSRANSFIEGSTFYDCWSVVTPESESSALELFIAAASKAPRWVNLAMSTRNFIVQFFGLKDLGSLDGFDADRDPDSYKSGDRIGIFTLFEQSFDEVLLGDKDKHLDVVLSVHRKLIDNGKAVVVSLTTIVHVKNRLGRLYMLPVTPAHRIIAPAILGRIA